MLLFIGTALAGSADISWTLATKYTDGSNIPSGTITATELGYGLCNAGKTAISGTPTILSVPAPSLATTVTGLGNGSWCFQVRTAIGTNVSDWTPVVSKDVILKPNPPSNLTVTTLAVYMELRQDNRLVMIPVGTVAGSTTCDPRNGTIANGVSYYAVPTSAVTWTGTTRPPVVFAICG